MVHSVIRKASQTCLGSWLALALGLLFGMVLSILNPASTRPSYTIHHTHRYSDAHFTTNQSVAQHMRDEIRILCWIMTGPQNHQSKAQHIRHTWGKHCNTLLFMTTAEDPELENTIALPIKEGRDYLWAKTKEAFKYIYEHHRNDADWFLKADDDSYVVMENLRAMVHPYPPEIPIYFGRKFNTPGKAKQCYMSGGAGYALSKRAMILHVEQGLSNASVCYAGHGHSEDLELGNCLTAVGVVAGDSRDAESDRFFPFGISYHLQVHRRSTYWYFTYCYYYPNDGQPGVTANAVSFHYVKPRSLYKYDYLIYHVRRFGRSHMPEPIHERKHILDEVNTLLAISDPFNRRQSIYSRVESN